MSRQPVPRIRRQTDIKQRYLQAYKKYVSCEFTYNSHTLLKKLCENGQKQPSIYNVPLYKIMIEITKFMMMNQLELLFFGATVQQMGWKTVDQGCLTPYIEEVIDITPKLDNKDNFVKKIQLSLLLIAYIVKIYLNQDSSLYDFKIRDLVRNNFQKMYQQWVQKVQNHFKFSPKNMNKLFKQLDKSKAKLDEKIVDYNNLVGELFNNEPQEDKDHGEKVQYYQAIEKHHPQKIKDDQGHRWGIGSHSGVISTHNVPSSQYKDLKKIQGLPVHEQQELKVPQLSGRTSSLHSRVSGIEGKTQTYNQLFEKGEFKNQRINSFISYPRDEDFLGNDGLE